MFQFTCSKVFYIPSSLCHDLEALFARFWWGFSKEGNKMHWATLKSLSRPKQFCRALLAKQAWKILTQPNSLMGRIFKGLYFQNSNFLEVTVSNSASFSWRSILWGRDLLSKVLRWRITNGKSVRAWTNLWLPRIPSIKPISPVPNWNNPCTHVKVAKFIEHGIWNVPKLNCCFQEEDVKIILSIGLNVYEKDDFLLWHYTKDGNYTVKSGYHLGHCSSFEAGPSKKSSFDSWWKKIWAFSIPNKFKVFLWKASNNFLPTKLILMKHGIKVDPPRPYCKGIDSTIHAVFTYPLIKSIWSFDDWLFLEDVLGEIEELFFGCV